MLILPHLPALDSWGAPLIATFPLLLWLQHKYPLRHQHFHPLRRIGRNLVFAIPSFVTLRLLLMPIPLAAVYWAERHDFGLLHWIGIPSMLAGIVGFLLLDYTYYWWHVATHKVPLLWRFHNVHHTDLEMDVSTATRFHFGELLLSVGFRVAQVGLLGIAPLTLLVFEVVFEIAGQFHHSNWRLWPALERLLNGIVVTPRMHGIHHSVVRAETDSNWGTIFSWWDRMHRTHCMDVPQDVIVIGVPGWRDERELTLLDLWKMPFGKQRSREG